MNEREKQAELVWVAISVKCPQSKYSIKRFICLRRDEAEVLTKVFFDGFVEPVEVRVLRGDELINWIQGKGGENDG